MKCMCAQTRPRFILSSERVLGGMEFEPMCAQTRPRFILSSERVLGGMEFEPMLTPREKSPLPENVPKGGSNPRRCGQRAQALPTELFWPPDDDMIIALKGTIQDFDNLLIAP